MATTKKNGPVTLIQISDVDTTKKKSSSKKQLRKVCVRCGQTKDIGDFFSNRGEAQGLYRDRYCKDCYKEMATDEPGLREYMYANGRVWSAECWASAQERAVNDVNTNPEYAAIRDEDIRNSIILKRALVVFPTLMNKNDFYHRFDPDAVSEDFNALKDIEDERNAKRDSEDPYYNLPIYSREWGGRYTKYEIDSMNEYYESVLKSRGIDDAIGENYARKFVKQSFVVDKLAETIRTDTSKETLAQYKDAVAALEALSAAGCLAPRYRKTETSYTMSSLAEFINAMEMGEMLMNEPVFPKDQIDGMEANLRHLAVSLGGSGGLWDTEGEKQ